MLKTFTTPVVPPRRPNLSEEELLERLRFGGLAANYEGALVYLGRGHYLNNAGGDHGENDRNTYDDAVALAEAYLDGDGRQRLRDLTTYNANVDPRAEGMNRAIGLPWPSLQPGVHEYRFGFHRGKYLALKPFTTVVVKRDGRTATERNATINGHAGGVSWTWSWGCWTIIADQYGARTTSLVRTGSGFIDRCWRMCLKTKQGRSLPKGRAGFRAFPDAGTDRPIPVVLVEEAAFRRAR